MKKFILIIVFFYSLIIFPQENIRNFNPIRKEHNQIDEPNFDKKLILKEIVNLLDSIREYIYNNNNLLTELDTVSSKGCQHHSKFLKNFVNIKNNDIFKLTHYENKYDKEFIYLGKDTLINNPNERHNYFSNGLMGFSGEVCSMGPLSMVSYKGSTPKDVAEQIIYSFYNSKEHWKILTSYLYTKIAADIQIKKLSNGTYDYFFTLVTGYGINMNKKVIKNKFYYPNNPLGLTEFYEEIEKKCVFNNLR